MLGLCIDCKSTAIEGNTRCQSCYEKLLIRSATQAKNRRENKDKCNYCGKDCENNVCDACKIKNAAYKKELRKTRAKSGLCNNCGSPEKLPLLLSCRKCYMKQQSKSNLGTSFLWSEIDTKFDSQNGKCYYTGILLVFGKNASLDHKNPRARFPEEASDIDNLVWCDKTVNEAKKSMTEEEFINLCKLVASRF